jgi:hypothetical protein
VTRSRTETLNTTARSLPADCPKTPRAAKVCRRSGIPTDARARRCRQSGNPGSIEARSRGCIGIRDAPAMNRVMHPYAAREGGVAAGSQRKADGVDSDVVTPPIDPAPAP